MENNQAIPTPRVVEPDRFERRAHAMIATMTDAGEVPEADRREGNRTRYLAQARMRWTDEGECQEMTLYTRDLTGEGVGFIAHGELTPSTRGTVELPDAAGKTVAAEAEVVRTKTFANGWNEGYVQFVSPIDLFSDQPIKAA